jgi:hypothetical protein
MKLPLLFLLPLCATIADEAPPFVQNAPEKPSKPKQTLKVSQNQALVTLSTELGKEARPSQIIGQKPEEKEKPPAEKKTPCFSLSGDFLYLKAKNEDLFYARRANVLEATGTSPFDNLSSHVLRIDPDYAPGFWITAEARPPCNDKWCVELGWMHLFSEKSSRHDEETNSLIHASIVNTRGNPFATSVHAKWHQYLNLIDLTLGRTLSATHRLKLTPFFGLRGALVNQKLHAHFENISYNLNKSGAFIDATLKNEFKGIGLITGLESCWMLGKGFHLFADGALSLLVSEIEVEQHENRGSGNINFVKDHLHSLTPLFDLTAGFGWKREFGKGRYAIDLYSGWQEQLWIHQTEFQLANGELAKGNFSLSGFFVGARCAF